MKNFLKEIFSLENFKMVGILSELTKNPDPLLFREFALLNNKNLNNKENIKKIA